MALLSNVVVLLAATRSLTAGDPTGLPLAFAVVFGMIFILACLAISGMPSAETAG